MDRRRRGERRSVQAARATRNASDYLDSERWQGKSGAYGVQDRDPFVAVVRGSFSNVVGLPMERLETLVASVSGLDSLSLNVTTDRARCDTIADGADFDPGARCGGGMPMSTVATTRRSEPPSGDSDPYRYGWRLVRVTRPDGTEFFDQVPLALEDVLFPEMGDFSMQSTAHNRDVHYADDVFESRLAGETSMAVVADCRVDWNLPGVRPLCPDVAVFFNVKQCAWRSIDVAADGLRPALVIEVTSPDTRGNDVEIKFDFYHRARVPLYVIADAIQDDDHDRRLRLIGYRYTPAAVPRDRAGRSGSALAGARPTVAGGDQGAAAGL